MNSENIAEYTEQFIQLIITRSPKILGGIVTLFVGLWIIRQLTRLSGQVLEKSNIDITVAKFLSSLISIGLKILLVISVAWMLGIQTTSFIALLWAAWLAIGLALQWSLANFAGWVLILVFKPYKVGDLVEIQWEKWHVIEIGILNTILTTLQNNTAIIPNGPIINNNILNFTTKDSVRVDIHIWIAYNEDIDNARKVLTEVLENNEFVLDNERNGIFVNELADSSVNLIVRAYTAPEQFRPAYFMITEECKKALDKANISIPFPHRVVHNTNIEWIRTIK